MSHYALNALSMRRAVNKTKLLVHMVTRTESVLGVGLTFFGDYSGSFEVALVGDEQQRFVE